RIPLSPPTRQPANPPRQRVPEWVPVEAFPRAARSGGIGTRFPELSRVPGGSVAPDARRWMVCLAQVVFRACRLSAVDAPGKGLQDLAQAVGLGDEVHVLRQSLDPA